MAVLNPHFLDLVQEALLASFWRLDALRRFLRRNGISESALAHLNKTTTKRQFLDWLFPKLEASPKGEGLLRAMARNLSQQDAFPDLQGWEDSEEKLQRAHRAVDELRSYLAREERARTDENERVRLRTEAASRRARKLSHVGRLEALKHRLESELLPKLGTSEGGYAFQDWFGELCDLFEVPHKKPFRSGTREVDGSIPVDGTTYLLSLKFEAEQVGSPGIDDIRVRLGRVADNTMGVVVSMSGFKDAAIDDASGPGTKLLLLGHDHVYAMLLGHMSLTEIVCRVREHAARTGSSYLRYADFCQT